MYKFILFTIYTYLHITYGYKGKKATTHTGPSGVATPTEIIHNGTQATANHQVNEQAAAQQRAPNIGPEFTIVNIIDNNNKLVNIEFESLLFYIIY